MKSFRKLLVLLFFAAPLLAQPSVVTKAFNNSRSGWNSQETILSQASIAQRGLVRQTIIPLCCDARGMEAQPLIVPKVKLKDASTHDVMILPSMSDTVRGVDAETGAGLWQVTLGTPITSNGQIDLHQTNQHWGCLSTGVIVSARWYGVCWTSKDGSGTPLSGAYEMFALNIADGSQAMAPVLVQGPDTSMWKQRSSLTFIPTLGPSGTIFFAHGSVFESGGGWNGYTGGIVAFDVAGNAVVATLPMTAGIWMAGQGLIADDEGYLYAITGNGDFDPSKGFYGESFVKVQYTPAAGALPAALKVIDQWSPWTDYQRAGQKAPATKVAGSSMPSETVKPVGGNMSMPLQNARITASLNERGQVVSLVYPMAKGAWADEDWGSAGPACIFALKVCVATGKDGIAYPIDSRHLGQTTAASVGTAANYAKLKAPCAWLTMSPGNVPCDPADARQLNFFPNGLTAHLHMTPVQLYEPLLKSWVLFAWGENSALHKWAVSTSGKLTYIAEGQELASVDARGRTPGGMPGGFCSGSSNGADANSMLLFCSIPYGDGNATITGGRFIVYDPVHPAADGSLKVLWDSQRWGIPYQYNKFLPPIVWNGRVYLPNYNGGVDVYGLS